VTIWHASPKHDALKRPTPASADTFNDRWRGQKLPVSESAWTARWSAGNE
jgi:hypothetical protein